MNTVTNLGFLDETARDVTGKSYAQFMRDMLPDDAPDTGNIMIDTAAALDLPGDSKIISDLDWLGLFDDGLIDVEESSISPLDLLTRQMLDRMKYAEDERDLIVLVHHFDASYPDGRREHITSSLIAVGEPNGDSAMARTVSLPAAIAVDLVLRGEIDLTGVQVPVTPELYNPILAGLKKQNIECIEKTEALA